MLNSEIKLTDIVLKYFNDNIDSLYNFCTINLLIKNVSGIKKFFIHQEEATKFLEAIKKNNFEISEFNRREYGDFQTNEKLASSICEYVLKKDQNFEFLLEPTCGKGNIILSSLEKFKTLKKVVGIEIYLPYVWETKIKILTYYLINNKLKKPEIEIIHANAFEFSYKELAESTKKFKTIIIGNPPWVTNSELSSIDSANLPKKSNFKNHKGFEAITGKGNFDIGEYISLIMIKYFQNHEGIFAFLIKNSVVKNLIYDQKQNNFKINNSEKLNIDSKKEFDASVNACLFITYLNKYVEYTCQELDFYNKKHITTFGWYQNKFVYSIDEYNLSSFIDNKSIFNWRSGIKHDCSKIMEITKYDNYFINGLKEIVNIEKDLVYGLLKSSDLKSKRINTFRKLTIVTQTKIGEETEYIKKDFPLTYKYLEKHKELFKKRKSTIYKDKPDYSIFGVGDYSFSSYKIGIAGFYNSTHFTLIEPNDSKPIMLDDTCYFIGFEKLKMAEIAHYLLNSEIVQKFLKSIVFPDSKRSINKDILMRIDLEKVFLNTSFEDVKEIIRNLDNDDWKEFHHLLKVKH